jgi:hypothetical protein
MGFNIDYFSIKIMLTPNHSIDKLIKYGRWV